MTERTVRNHEQASDPDERWMWGPNTCSPGDDGIVVVGPLGVPSPSMLLGDAK